MSPKSQTKTPVVDCDNSINHEIMDTSVPNRGWMRLIGQAGGLRRQLTSAMIGTFALNLTSKLLMLGTTVLLARYMGPHDYGIYASALAALTLVSIPAALGLPNLWLNPSTLCNCI